MQEYYKELEIKAKKLKAANIRKRNIQENILKSMEAEREKRIEEYFIENEKKEQTVMVSKARKKQKVLNQTMHEDEF